MTVNALTLAVSVIALLAALALLVRCRQLWLQSSKRDGTALLGCGIAAAALAVGIWFFISQLKSTLEPPAPGWTSWTAPAAAGGTSFIQLSGSPALGPVRPWVTLEIEGRALDAEVARAQQDGHWLLLDASRGVRPEYLSWIESRFGKLEALPPQQDGKSADRWVCYRRTDLYPLASGRCVSRSIPYSLAPSPMDLGRLLDHKAAVTARVEGKSVIVLSTAAIPRIESVEEGCLAALGRGAGCAALEVLPSGTTSSVVVRSNENHHGKIFREFEVPIPQELDEALAIYDQTTPITVSVDERQHEFPVCGGMLGSNQIRLLKLSSASTMLTKARSETDTAVALTELERIRDCPAIGLVEIPTLQFRRENAALRSILTQIRERPLWLTTPESLKIRFDKIDRVQMSWQSTDATLWLRPGVRLEKLAVTVLANRPVSDSDLGRVSSSDDRIGVSVHRLTSAAFRISWDELRTVAGVRFTSKAWKEGPEPAFAFIDWTGFAGAMLTAFIFAAMLNIFQSVAVAPGKSKAFYAGTFMAVFVIGFTWTFLSYRAALSPTGMSISEAFVERLPAPEHFFLREWPDTPRSPTLTAGAAGDLWTRWANLLKLAKGELPKRLRLRPGQVQVAGVARLPRNVLSGGARIVVWDDSRARNAHFRRSPEYQASVVGWETLLRRRRDIHSIETGSTADLALRRAPQVLIIPDARFLDPDDHRRLQAWVESGGTLVVSEGPNTGGVDAGSGGGWLSAAGFGASSPRAYSRVLLPGSRMVEIGVPHFVTGDRWFNAIALGQGRLFYLGLPPADRASQEVLSSWVGGISGERVSVVDSGKLCRTGLLMEPWGASSEKLRSTAFALRTQGVPVQWLVDPESFARMVPQWQDEFKRDGVVFRDDGTRQTRELAALLAASAGWTDPASLLFATDKNQAGFDKTVPGPESATLLRYIPFPGGEDVSRALAQWKTECRFGGADMRLIDSRWVESGISLAMFSGDGELARGSILPAHEAARVFRAVQGNGGGVRRTLSSNRLDPLLLEWEAQQ